MTCLNENIYPIGYSLLPDLYSPMSTSKLQVVHFTPLRSPDTTSYAIARSDFLRHRLAQVGLPGCQCKGTLLSVLIRQ